MNNDNDNKNAYNNIDHENLKIEIVLSWNAETYKNIIYLIIKWEGFFDYCVALHNNKLRINEILNAKTSSSKWKTNNQITYIFNILKFLSVIRVRLLFTSQVWFRRTTYLMYNTYTMIIHDLSSFFTVFVY